MIAYIFVVIAIAARLLSATHPGMAVFNFTPVAASLLYFGARMPRKQAWIPVALFAASDLLLTRFVYGYKLGVSELVSLAWYAAIVLFAGLLRSSSSPLRLAGASLTASISFFAISNFAVWAEWPTYTKNLAGLVECYTMALPFFRNQIAGDLFFTMGFFSIGALLLASRRSAQPVA